MDLVLQVLLMKLGLVYLVWYIWLFTFQTLCLVYSILQIQHWRFGLVERAVRFCRLRGNRLLFELRTWIFVLWIRNEVISTRYSIPIGGCKPGTARSRLGPHQAEFRSAPWPEFWLLIGHSTGAGTRCAYPRSQSEAELTPHGRNIPSEVFACLIFFVANHTPILGEGGSKIFRKKANLLM